MCCESQRKVRRAYRNVCFVPAPEFRVTSPIRSALRPSRSFGADRASPRSGHSVPRANIIAHETILVPPSGGRNPSRNDGTHRFYYCVPHAANIRKTAAVRTPNSQAWAVYQTVRRFVAFAFPSIVACGENAL
jgi:hypothetical protein